MDIIIVYDQDKNETLEQANELEKLIQISLHHDAWEAGIDQLDFEFDILDAYSFDLKCPEWFN